MNTSRRISGVLLIFGLLLTPQISSAQNVKITRLACDALVIESYSNGQKEQSREKFTLGIETYSNGYMVFAAETPKVFISMPSRGKKGTAEVVDNSTPEVWRFTLSATIKGQRLTSTLKLDRVTGELYYYHSGVMVTEVTGYCEKTDAGNRKF